MTLCFLALLFVLSSSALPGCLILHTLCLPFSSLTAVSLTCSPLGLPNLFLLALFPFTLHFHGLVTVNRLHYGKGISTLLPLFHINVEVVVILPSETFNFPVHVFQYVVLIPVTVCQYMKTITLTYPNFCVILNQSRFQNLLYCHIFLLSPRLYHAGVVGASFMLLM